MATTIDHATITSLDQMTEADAELQELRAAAADARSQHDQVLARAEAIATEQRHARQTLVEAKTDAEREGARSALADLGAEVSVLPHETAVTAEAAAHALHLWAAAAFDRAESLLASARADARELEEPAGDAPDDKEEYVWLTRRASVRYSECERTVNAIGREILDCCRPVFRTSTGVAAPTGIRQLRGRGSHLDGEGNLTGHERWVDSQRRMVEELLSA
jgi:hypothetical protein